LEGGSGKAGDLGGCLAQKLWREIEAEAIKDRGRIAKLLTLLVKVQEPVELAFHSRWMARRSCAGRPILFSPSTMDATVQCGRSDPNSRWLVEKSFNTAAMPGGFVATLATS
jgi:hypothetical protein